MNASTEEKQSIWDLPVRLLHWLLMASVAAAWMTRTQTGEAHAGYGYAAAGVVFARFGWSFFGNRYARFAQFVLPLRPTLAYLRAVRAGRAPRYLGHNPLGGWMVVALLSNVALLGLSGWLMSTDWLWGYAWPVRIHAALGWLLIGLVALHIAGVAFTSWQHRENLIAAMFTGKK